MEHRIWTKADILNMALVGFRGKALPVFAEVSRSWRGAWGDGPIATSVMTAHTSAARLLYIFECGLQRDGNLCADATKFDKLHVLQCARQNDCSWDEQMCSQAATGGYPPVPGTAWRAV